MPSALSILPRTTNYWQACREIHLGFPAGTFGDLEFGFLNWITNFFNLDTNWVIWNLASLHLTLDFWEFASQIELDTLIVKIFSLFRLLIIIYMSFVLRL